MRELNACSNGAARSMHWRLQLTGEHSLTEWVGSSQTPPVLTDHLVSRRAGGGARRRAFKAMARWTSYPVGPTWLALTKQAQAPHSSTCCMKGERGQRSRHSRWQVPTGARQVRSAQDSIVNTMREHEHAAAAGTTAGAVGVPEPLRRSPQNPRCRTSPTLMAVCARCCVSCTARAAGGPGSDQRASSDQTD
jgi:hypothetical protein